MKKLSLLAAAGLAAMSMNAQIYVMGNGSGLSWETFPGQEVSLGSDGNYTFNLSACDQFKVSTVNASNWDDFNSGAFAPDNATHSFTNAVFNQGGETVSTVSWGENISLPQNGRYTIVVNQECTQITAIANFAQSTDAPAVYIRGAMNGWGSPDAWKFTNVSYDAATGTGTWTFTGSITAGVEFKIADATWGNINYTVGGTVANYDTSITLKHNDPANTKMGSDFNGTITFKITGAKAATATFTPSGSGPVYPANLYIIGTINGNAWDPSNVAAMSNEGDGQYSITGVRLAENAGSTGFAITGGGATWDDVNALRFGPAVNDTPAVVGENAVDGIGDLSWSIAPGTYNMVFDYDEKVLYIENGNGGGGDNPDKPDPNPGEEGVNTIYVLGQGDGLGWDFPGMAVNKDDNGNFTFTVNNLAYFKVSTVMATEWDGDNGFNAHAYATGTTTFGDQVSNKGGQTLPIEPWGENQELPWIGNYTITISGNMKTMTAYTSTPKPTGAPDVYIRGDMNGWLNDGLSDTWKMTYNATDAVYTFTCEDETVLPAGSMFKFADQAWAAVNFGNGNTSITLYDGVTEEVLSKGGNNMAMAEDFTGVVTLKIEGNDAVATFTQTTTDGIGSIDADNGTAVYYNLQGQRVANPAPGQVVIKVTNGKAVKVIFGA